MKVISISEEHNHEISKVSNPVNVLILFKIVLNFYGAYTTLKVAVHILETTMKQKSAKFNKMKQIKIPCRIFLKNALK